jgi:hypothetical protein
MKDIYPALTNPGQDGDPVALPRQQPLTTQGKEDILKKAKY